MSENPSGYVSDELYKQVTDSFPIVCIDLIFYDAATGRIGTITRATGAESGLMAVVGGRIRKGELASDAISRHLREDLGITDYSFVGGNSADCPFFVGQYAHAPRAEGGFKMFDPSKHSLGLTFLISIKDTPKPRAEASQFHWITEEEIPEKTAYNQGLLMHQAFRFLAN